ncbi:hypothetical protein L0244_25675, partial [bacterium]|nr:hypothetical protein [bacterium]MCI0693263.1 hypothetical protein [candidate division KSB1 bacterium]
PRVRNGSIGGNSYLNPGIRPTFGRSGFVDDFSGRNGLAQTARAFADYRRYGLTGSGIPVLVTPEDVGRYNRQVLTNSAKSFARAAGKAGKYTLKTTGFIWTLPNTAIGFGLVEANKKLAPELRARGIDVADPEFIGFDSENWVLGYRNTLFPLGFGEGWITFGHVVLANHPWKDGFGDPWYQHELVHVFQYDLFGPTFLPLYLSNYLINLPIYGRRAYENILFEIWARHVSGR